MEIQSRQKNDVVVLSVRGKMDTLSVPKFEKCLSGLVSRGEIFLLINFSALEYICSAGLRSILATAKALKAKSGEIIFAGISGLVRKVFQTAYFFSIFKVFDTEEEALHQFKTVDVLGTLTLPAGIESLPKFLHFVMSRLADQGLSKTRAEKIQLATEEALVNVFHHAYPSGKGDVEVTCRANEKQFVIEITDRGDRLPMHEGHSSRGLGFSLIREMVSDVQYIEEGARHILQLVVLKD